MLQLTCVGWHFWQLNSTNPKVTGYFLFGNHFKQVICLETALKGLSVCSLWYFEYARDGEMDR